MIGEIKVDELSQIQSRHHKEERDRTLVINSEDTNSNQMIGEIERDEQSQDEEQTQSMPREEQRDMTLVINNDQTTAHKVAEQPSRDEEKTQNFHVEGWGLRHLSNSEEMIEIDRTKDNLPNWKHELIQSISHGDLLDPQEKKSTLESSECSICKTKQPNIERRKEFTYEELQAATDGFSLKNCLSESGCLSTFKGQLEGRLKIVVKQHEITNSQVREKIKSEVQSILKATHKNVVMLLGSTTQESSLLTVYEYACNGSLDQYLSSKD